MHLISRNKFVQQETIKTKKAFHLKALDNVIIIVTSSEWELFLQRLNTEEFHQLDCILLLLLCCCADAFMEQVFAHR